MMLCVNLLQRNALKLVQKKGFVDHKCPSTFSEPNGRIEKIKKRVRESRGEKAKSEEIRGDQIFELFFFYLKIFFVDDSFELKTPPLLKKHKRNLTEIDDLINAKSSHDWVNQEV